MFIDVHLNYACLSIINKWYKAGVDKNKEAWIYPAKQNIWHSLACMHCKLIKFVSCEY